MRNWVTRSNTSAVSLTQGLWGARKGPELAEARIQRVADLHPGNGDEVPIVGPDFAGTVFERDHRDLEIENPSASHLQGCRPPHEPLSEARAWCPKVAVT